MRVRRKNAVERSKTNASLNLWGQNNQGMFFWSFAIFFSLAGAERAVCIPLFFGCVALFREMVPNSIQNLLRGTSRSPRTIARPFAWIGMAGLAVWAFFGGLDSDEPIILGLDLGSALITVYFAAISLVKEKNSEHMVDVIGEEDEKAMARRVEHGSENQVFSIVMICAFFGACGIWAKYLPDECEICVGDGQVEVLLLPSTFADLDVPHVGRELRDFVCWNCEGEGEVPDAEEPWSEAAKRQWNYDAARRGHVPAQIHMVKALWTSRRSDRPLPKECEAWYLLLPPEQLETSNPNITYVGLSNWNKPRFSPFIAGPDGERAREARARAMELQAEILSNLQSVTAKEEQESLK